MIAEPIAARIRCMPAQKGNSKKIVWRRGAKGKRVPRLVSSDADKAAEIALTRALSRYAPDHPIAVPVSLTLAILHPIPKEGSWPKWRREAAQHGIVRPASVGTHDSCNVLKLVEDAIEAARWITNDTLIVEHAISALYSAEPGYRIVIRPLYVLVPSALKSDWSSLLESISDPCD